MVPNRAANGATGATRGAGGTESGSKGGTNESTTTYDYIV